MAQNNRKLEVHSQGVVRVIQPLKSPWKMPLLASSGFWKTLAFFGLEMHHSGLCLCLLMAFFSVSLFQCSKVPVPIKTPIILDLEPTLIQYDLILTGSHLTLFPNKVVFTGSE